MTLLKFLVNYISEKAPDLAPLDGGKKIHLAGGADDLKARRITSTGTDYLEQECSHEESDTRMMFHALLEDQCFREEGTTGRIIIKCPDTDVFVLAVYHFIKLNITDELWLQTGVLSTNKDMHRYTPVHDLCKSLDPMLIKILPPVHAITGCDTTSSFFRIRKVTVMNTIKKAGTNSFKGLASFHNMKPDEVTDEARKLTARLYDPKGKFLRDHSNLNVLRSKITATKDVPIAQLPPSEASFNEHAKRALWQSKAWANACIGLPDLGNPQDYGWEKVNNIMTPIMFKGICSAEMLKTLVCSCNPKNKKVCSRQCSCAQANMRCCEVCPCSANEDECYNDIIHQQMKYDGNF